jgi:hypothetical protein
LPPSQLARPVRPTPAYLSNPGENSFRAYLTELSFRQHLSRLDDTSDDDHSDVEDANAHLTSLYARPPSAVARPPVHFASRASVSLRTPRHVLHNCGILTIGAVIPEDRDVRMGRSRGEPTSADLEASSNVGDSWYIGAFGKWWRGGVLDAWWLDSVAKTHVNDAERWNSGILEITTLDRREGQ